MERVLTLGRGMRKMRAEKPMLTACLEDEEDGEEEEPRNLNFSRFSGSRKEAGKKIIHMEKMSWCSDRSDNFADYLTLTLNTQYSLFILSYLILSYLISSRIHSTTDAFRGFRQWTSLDNYHSVGSINMTLSSLTQCYQNYALRYTSLEMGPALRVKLLSLNDNCPSPSISLEVKTMQRLSPPRRKVSTG